MTIKFETYIAKQEEKSYLEINLDNTIPSKVLARSPDMKGCARVDITKLILITTELAYNELYTCKKSSLFFAHIFKINLPF